MFSTTSRLVVFMLIIFALPTSISACTTFVLKDGANLLFGRNLDWVSDDGVIVVNNRGIAKTALVMPPHLPAKWISSYGSVTFNQFGAEFPFGGMNEKGLVVEIMLAQATYPEPDQRAALNELQWVQYQLDNSATIDDVIQSNELIRIRKINQNLHFLICDASGASAVIEFINGKMVVYRGNDLPIAVLANDSYLQSLDQFNVKKSCRFTKAAEAVVSFSSVKSEPVEYAFNMLEEVALEASWSIVYDVRNMRIYFNTSSNRRVSSLDVKAFDFECSASRKLFDLKGKRHEQITADFVMFNPELNQSKMKSGIRSNAIRLPSTFVDALLNYPALCLCN